MGGRLLKGWPALLLTLSLALVLASPAQATFPGQNGKLAFERHPFSDSTSSRTWTMNPDGSDLAQLEDECGQVPVALPQWSPDGSKLLYVCWYSILRMINADGTGDEFEYDNTDNIAALAWSPDSRQIAFTGYWWTEDDGYHFYTVVWPAPGYDGGPTFLSNQATYWLDWSPDGRSIALNSGGGISTINPDGTGLTFLTGGSDASWSPDNSKLAFWNRDAGGWNQIYTIKADGSDLTKITTSAAHKGGPVWSPDGTKIAFTGRLDGQALPDIYRMDADGSNVVRVTSTPDVEEYLDWQPIPINAYPRPAGAYPTRVSLVPAYQPCSSPNRTHGPPLGFGSCNPPTQEPGQLTVGTPDANGQGAKSLGHLRVTTLTGNPATPDDEADVRVRANITDVRLRSDLSDYTGDLEARLRIQITDKNNTPHPGGPGAATVQEFTQSLQIPCAGTANTTVGSTCQLDTTVEALLPGAVVEKRRAIWELGAIRVHDGAGNLFMTQGLFVP